MLKGCTETKDFLKKIVKLVIKYFDYITPWKKDVESNCDERNTHF
jgi:hypothetical protein